MAKRGTRKGKFGLVRRLYSPVNHSVSAVRSVGSNAFRRSGRIVNTGLGFVQNTGRALTGHLDAAVNNLVRGRRGKSRRNNMRKSRRATRRNRK